MEKKLFQCRIEELSVLGASVHNSLVRDANDFARYLAFNSPFPEDFLLKTQEVINVVSPVVIIGQLKMVTFRLLTNSYGLRALLNSAEVYFKSAGSSLDVAVKDMGLHAVRVSIDLGDTEQLLLDGNVLNQNIARNDDALDDVGMTEEMQEALVEAFEVISVDNLLQTSLRGTRSSTTESDMVLYNDYWRTYVSPTLVAGKLIYKISKPAKAKDYTASRLISYMRHDGAQTEVFGRVCTEDGKPVNKAKVKLIPVNGGRTKTVYTNAEGKYSMRGMKACDYNQVVTKGSLLKINALTVVTREHIELNSVIV